MNITLKALFLFFAPCFLCLVSCNTNYTVDKKRGYFKIFFPEKKNTLPSISPVTLIHSSILSMQK